MTRPKALILLATGTNRDQDVAQALEIAGAAPEIVPLKALRQSARPWSSYQILVVAGGFSYAYALGAGKLLALDLVHYFSEETAGFVCAGKPVIGICNGFQALVKSGLLPGGPAKASGPQATLTFNQSGRFECRWVTLKPVSEICLWTRGLGEAIDCPVAHGEGNFVVSAPAAAHQLSAAGQIALVYAGPDGRPAGGAYPANPNGSVLDIAGICNPAGNELGLMPHPENHVLPYQHPHWTRGEGQHSGLPLFINGVKFAHETG
jgi:phosphoribosylformylglycinamidine synthase I